jgi:apolipoprotein N-acyltransferase
VNISNEGWFRASSELDQAVVMSRFRAIETRVPMLRCTNTGITCNIDALGRVRETLTVDGYDRLKQGVLVARPCVLDRARRVDQTVFVRLYRQHSPALAATMLDVFLLALMFAGRVRKLLARRPRAE